VIAGRPLQVLKRTVVLRIVYCMTLLPLAALFGVAAAASLEGKQPDVIAAVVWGVVAAALLGLLAWLCRREATRRIRLHEEGIVAVAGRKTVELPWSDVEQVWFRAIRVNAGGLLGVAIGAAVDASRGGKSRPLNEASTSIAVRILGGGRKIKLTSNYRGVVPAFEEVLRRVNPRLVDDCLRRIREGQPVRFGKVTLSAAGVQFGRKAVLPFRDIERLEIARGRLLLRIRGGWFSRGRVQVRDIPNFTVLTAAFDRLRGGQGRVEVDGNLASTESL
jgi:hypothetical protein